MNYTGIDYHKRYSVACTLDAQGRQFQEGRIDGNAVAAFAAYFKQLGAPSEVVIEACWNWGTLYDVLEYIDGVAKVVLSPPGEEPHHRGCADQKRPRRCEGARHVVAG